MPPKNSPRRTFKHSRLTNLAHKMMDWIGSVPSLVVHTVIFAGSFALVFAGYELNKILLVVTTLVSLEAIYMAIFIQMAVNQNTQSLDAVEEDIDEIQEDIDEIQEDVDEIQEDVDEIQEDVEEIEKDVDEIQKDVDEIEKELPDDEEHSDKDKEALDKLEERLTKLVSQLEKMRESSTSAATETKSE